MKYYKLDKDVKQYLKRMSVDGIRTPPDIYSVNDFVVGLKDLNLWSLVYEGWFLRRNQNAGTGTRVYGIRNILNGTLINGSWGDAGMIFTLNTGYINFGFFDVTNIFRFSNFAILNTMANNHNSTIMSINAGGVSNSSGSRYEHAIFGPTGNIVCRENNLTGGSNTRIWGSANYTNVGIGFYFTATGRDNIQNPNISNGFTEHNAFRTTSITGTGQLPRTYTDAITQIFSGGGSNRNEVCAFQMWFLEMLDINQTALLRSLSKATIGKGLNLP